MKHDLPESLALAPALIAYAQSGETQSGKHIRPMHEYITLRLVLEGGFMPDEVTPRPPLKATKVGKQWVLEFDASLASQREQTIIGGLKAKAVDVAVSKAQIGPVLCVSVKGTGNAFRNLTNRMEEAWGDCTNLHIMYPGLVFGFFHLIKAHHPDQLGLGSNDYSLDREGRAVDSIRRYHDVLAGLTGRRYVRNDYTRYEAVALVMVECRPAMLGAICPALPAPDSPLIMDTFFDRMYEVYDIRYPYMAASLANTHRVAWSEKSPAVQSILAGMGPEYQGHIGYGVRLA